jgi:hypothetical protein
VEAYRAQNDLTQYFNCHQFGHVWVNCRQPFRCMWSRGGHTHNECPEKVNTPSTTTCCNCKLADDDKPPLSTYRGCSHAKDEMRKSKSQRTPKTKTGKAFSFIYTTPGLSFAAALRNNEQQKRPHPRQVAVAGPATMEYPRVPAPLQHHQQQETGHQSVRAPNINISSLNDMFKVSSVAQQITTELNGAVS